MPGCSRLLPLALCLWTTCSVCTGELDATSVSESVVDSALERTAVGAPDLASEQIVDTLAPGEHPGRRRRADARRRTHSPAKSPAEKLMEQRIKNEQALTEATKAREEALEVQTRKEQVERAAQKMRYDQAKGIIEAKITLEEQRHREAEEDVKQAKARHAAATATEAENLELEQEEKDTIAKTKVLRSAIQEALHNVNDALGFCRAVKDGDGTITYQKSYLADEHRLQQVGGPGGFAQLSGEQLNVPWLANLNKALGAAKLDTSMQNMMTIQKLLDKAEVNVESLERKWKDEESHRTKVNEALSKDTVKREVREKEAAKREVVTKKMAELKSKESSRKAKLAALKAKTTTLKKQANELEEKALRQAADEAKAQRMAAQNTTKSKDNKESSNKSGSSDGKHEVRLGVSQGESPHELIVDAQHARAEASKFKAMEHQSKQQLRAEKAKLRAATHAIKKEER